MTALLAFLAIAAATCLVCWLTSESMPCDADYVFQLFWICSIASGPLLVIGCDADWPVIVVGVLAPPLVMVAYGVVDIWWQMRRQRRRK